MATLRKRNRNGKEVKRWFARVQKNGDVRSKEFPTKKEALDWEAEQRKLDWEETNMDSLTMYEWATQYLNDVKARLSHKTYAEKRVMFRCFLKAVDPGTPVSKLTSKMALDYLTVQNKTRSGNAANKDRKNLVAAYNWGIKYLDLVRPNPVAVVDKFPEKRKKRYVPPESDFWRVLEVAEGQDKVMLAVALYTAARRGEIFRLRWEDIDFDNGTIRLSTRKRQGGSLEHDILPMVPEFREHLVWWEDARKFKDSQYVFVCENESAAHAEILGQPFTTRRTFMSSLCKKAGVKPFGFHAIRHLTASILFHKGKSVAVIQAILRHQSPTTTTRYLKSLGLENLRSALEDLTPTMGSLSTNNKTLRGETSEGLKGEL